MTTDRIDANHPEWTLVRSTFEDCLELTPDDRDAKLAALAPAVRREVEQLLGIAARAGGRMEPRASAFAVPALQSGTMVGDVRLLAPLGSGGMGVVWLGEQAEPRRQVAVKLLRDALSSGSAEQRFQREAALLARLRHPGIAQVYSVGMFEQQTDFGRLHRPYFVMELVESATDLREHVRAKNLDRGARLRLFATLCDAVQHAHERGIVHRDLKPQNVLVDAAGHVKVVDFGIARAVTEDVATDWRTRDGDVVGTLQYMSPEQLLGRPDLVDARSDVFALGVLLFELVAGTLPYELSTRTVAEAVRVVDGSEPRRLRQVVADADPDLELIVRTALARDPACRYATAGALAADLRLHLSRRPITARPPTLRYQARMFASRHRGLVAGAALAVVATFAGGVLTIVQAVRARAAEAVAVAQRAQVAAAVQKVFDDAMAAALDTTQRLEGVQGTTRVRHGVLDRAIQQLAYVEANVPLDADMRLMIARAHRRLGEIQGGNGVDHLGDHAAAAASYRRALDYADQVVADRPDDRDALLLVGETALRLGDVLFERSRDVDGAEAQWQRADAVLTRLGSNGSTADRRQRELLAGRQERLASLAGMRRDLPGHLQALRAAERLRIELTASPDAEPGTWFDLANVRLRLGRAYDQLALQSDSLTTFRSALTTAEQSVGASREPRRRLLVARIRAEYGHSLAKNGAPDEADAELRRAIDELEALFRDSPDNAALAASLGFACALLADQSSVAGRRATDRDRAKAHYVAARAFAVRGLEVSAPLGERGRDMQQIWVVGVCREVVAECDVALKDD